MASFAKKKILKLNPLVFCPFIRGFFNVKSNLKNCHFKTAIVELSEKVVEKWEAWWVGVGQKMRKQVGNCYN